MFQLNFFVSTTEDARSQEDMVKWEGFWIQLMKREEVCKQFWQMQFSWKKMATILYHYHGKQP